MKEVVTYTAKQQGTTMLNANELYRDITDRIREEIKEAMNDIAFQRYPDETSQALIETYSTVMKLHPEQILAGNGSDEMLGLLIGYFLGKDKTLLTLQPDFSMYDYYAGMHEANVLKYPCAEDGSFHTYDFIEYGREQQVTMILFSNPNNPTGHHITNKELMKIVEAFPTIPVIIDEAYGEFAPESMVEELDKYPNLYVTRTLSKAYGLAGARLGFLMSTKKNIATLRTYMVPYNISSITQKIGVIVLQHAQEYQAYVREVIKERDTLYQKVKAFKKVLFYPSSANYLYGRSDKKETLLAMLEANGIVIRTYGDDTFRITIGSKEENSMVLRILERFEKEA